MDSLNRVAVHSPFATATWRSCPRSSMNSFRGHGSRRAVRTPSSAGILDLENDVDAVRYPVRELHHHPGGHVPTGSQISDERAER
jgi:hypothetical protein